MRIPDHEIELEDCFSDYCELHGTDISCHDRCPECRDEAFDRDLQDMLDERGRGK